jgi:hypothetical protein
MTTRTSKRCWVGFAALVALQSSGPAFAEECDPKFFICTYCWGDPHCCTEDGVRYDFQGAGEFTLVRDAGLEIQTRQTPVVSGATPSVPEAYSGLASCVSLNTAVAMRLGEHRVSYEPKWGAGPDPSPTSLELRVDGKLEALSASGLVYSDGSSILKTSSPGGLMITFPDRSILQVTPAWWPTYSTWYLNYEVMHPKAAGGKPGKSPRGGILGTISPGGWLPALPNGSSLGPRPSDLHGRYVALNQKFADAWRVTGKTSLFDYAPGTTTETFTTRSWPPEHGACVIPKVKPIKLDSPATEQAATNACRDITDEARRKACVFDVQVTGHLDFAKAYVAGQKARAGATKTSLTEDHPQTIELSPVTFTAVVAPLAGSKGTPTGSVQFWGDGKPREKFPLDAKGQATWTTNRIVAGVHTIAATYEPADGSAFVGSSSQAVTFTVVKK